jgi:uncharacterized protein DUF6335
MVKRKGARRAKTTRPRSTRRRAAPKRAMKARKKSAARTKPARKAAARRATRPRKSAVATALARSSRSAPAARKRPQLDRARRTLEEIVPTPPSSLDMDRHASAARTGRAELAENRRNHGAITTDITGGDVDANLENAYFSGEEAPGGDNPTPDQDVVEDIGRALGIEYQDNEELRASDKVTDRDRHRWELDPASSEDYKERD